MTLRTVIQKNLLHIHNQKSSDSFIQPQSCIKVAVEPILHPIIALDFSFYVPIHSCIKNYLSYLNTLKNTYSALQSSENHFKVLVHSVCLDQDPATGLKVLLISTIASTKGKILIDFKDSLPFFVPIGEVLNKETEKILKAWTEYSEVLHQLVFPRDPNFNILETIKRLEDLKSFLEHSRDLEQNSLFGEFIFILNSVILMANSMIKYVKNIVFRFKSLFKNFKNNIEFFRIAGDMAWKLKMFTGKEIAHLIFVNR